MKKTYLQPAMMVVTLQQQGIICTSNGVKRVSTNLGEGNDFDFGGGSTQSARVKSNTVDWDDDWSE